MGTDLNAPLGQNRAGRPGSGRSFPRPSAQRLLGGIAVAALAGLSAYSVIRTDPLRLSMPEAPAVVADAGEKAPERRPSDRGRRQQNGGANVETMLTNDGSVVTKYSPRARETGGPAFLKVGPVRGQDPRMAAFPNEDLLEETPDGRLPVVGPDGLRPMDQYARPWSGARGTRIALVVGGLGLSQTGTQKAIRDLPADVTLAFAASGNSLTRWMQEARRGGHEILLQLPLEPYDYPDNDPGPDTLLVDRPAQATLKTFRAALGRITNYTGVMNYLGGRFLSDADALEPVMRDVGKRGLLFLDDGTSAQSLSGTVADAIDVPHGFADLVVDTDVNETAILKRLDDLERIARRNGSAIGVASGFDQSVRAITRWMGEAEARGIEFVGVAALVKDPEQQP
ncbi:divergent polysaccharide deacetylase family protein [Ensifer soli]|uniref:divergent polysaccharide deacetylase family protein n=1 Tax=Ciceribacter sp. sgz301302 TaxID=3342379 RepID=UPI0035BA3F02